MLRSRPCCPTFLALPCRKERTTTPVTWKASLAPQIHLNPQYPSPRRTRRKGRCRWSEYDMTPKSKATRARACVRRIEPKKSTGVGRKNASFVDGSHIAITEGRLAGRRFLKTHEFEALTPSSRDSRSLLPAVSRHHTFQPVGPRSLLPCPLAGQGPLASHARPLVNVGTDPTAGDQCQRLGDSPAGIRRHGMKGATRFIAHPSTWLDSSVSHQMGQPSMLCCGPRYLPNPSGSSSPVMVHPR